MIKNLNTYKWLEESIYFNSLKDNYLQILDSGKNIIWLNKNEDNDYFLVEQCTVSFDILKNFYNLRKKITNNNYYLLINYKNGFFRGNICFNKRFNFTEPKVEFVVLSKKGRSLKEVLKKIDKNLDIYKEETDNYKEKIIDLSLVRKKREYINELNDRWKI